MPTAPGWWRRPRPQARRRANLDFRRAQYFGRWACGSRRGTHLVSVEFLTRGRLMNISKLLAKTVAALGLALALAGCGVNDIPAKDQAVKARFADVQAAYQRRS